MGFVDRLVPDGTALDAAIELAEDIAGVAVGAAWSATGGRSTTASASAWPRRWPTRTGWAARSSSPTTSRRGGPLRRATAPGAAGRSSVSVPAVEVDQVITCIDCGGRPTWSPTRPRARTWEPGDLVVYRCEDCLDRWDLVVPEDDETG